MSFEQIKRNYDKGLLSKKLVNHDVKQGYITSAQYQEITGDPYTA